MSETNYWTRVRRNRLSRRSLLGASARAGVGAAGLALVGCGDDDDDDAAVAQTQAEAEQAEQAQAEQAQAEAQAEAQAQAEPEEQAEEQMVANVSPGDWSGFNPNTLGTLVDGDEWSREPPSLDPFVETSFLAQRMGTNSYSRLLKFDTGPGIPALSAVTGDAAETFESVDPDGLEWVFNLRDMSFHDVAPLNGRKMTAEDVTTSFERFNELSANFRIFTTIDSMDAVDDSTVRITNNQSFAGFLENIASPSGLFIFSKEANAGDIDPNREDGVIGTGPFIFDGIEPAVQIKFSRNPNYYQTVTLPDGTEFSLPAHAQFNHIFTTEYATRLSTFVDGVSDYWDVDGNNRDVSVIQEQVPDVQLYPETPGWLFAGYQFNQTSENGLWQDPRARIAVSHAIDRAGLVEAFGETDLIQQQLGVSLPTGWGTLVPWGKGGEFWWTDPRAALEAGEEWAAPFEYNPQKGQEMLDAAGYDGSAVDMNYLQGTYGSVYDNFTEAQLPMLAAIGLNIESKIREYAQQWSSEASRDFPGLYYNYVTPFNTIDEYMQLWFSPDNDDVRHPVQRKIRTPEIDELVAKQRTQFDRSERQASVHEVIRQASSIMNVVPSNRIGWGFINVVQPWLHNWLVFESAGYGTWVEEYAALWTERV